MLKKPSNEWDSYIKRLQSIKRKSNREVLCTKCWMILNYEQRGKHSSKFPKHNSWILTSSQFASEIQFYHIAFMNNKVIEKNNGDKLVIQPCLFDPKKGTGHMKMMEELCREMHSEHEDLPSPDNLGEKPQKIMKKSCTSVPKAHQKTRGVMAGDLLMKKLNDISMSIEDISIQVYSSLYWLETNCTPSYTQNTSFQEVSRSINKRIKISESEASNSIQPKGVSLYNEFLDDNTKLACSTNNVSPALSPQSTSIFKNLTSEYQMEKSGLSNATAFSPFQKHY